MLVGRIVVLAAAFSVVTLPGELVAAQQTSPPCPADDEAVTTHAPEYLRDGASLAFTIDRSGSAQIDQVVVTYPAESGEPTSETFTFPEYDSRIRVIRPAPDVASFDLTFVWVQNPGRPDACTGTDRSTNIPVVPRGARVGRPGVARLSGRYRLTARRGGPSRRWTLRPRCDVFGCATSVRSSGGLRGTLRPRDDGTYGLTARVRAGRCVVGYSDGTRETLTVFEYARYSLRVIRRRTTDGVALDLTGRLVLWQEAPSDEGGVCNVPERRQVTRVRLRRIGA
jgi:hypothetical protein